MPRKISRRSPLPKPVVWVTGASRGIGREIAKQFAAVGCRVALTARSKQRLTSLQREIHTLGGEARAYPSDMARPQSLVRTASRIFHGYGSIDVLINNAGVTVFKTLGDTSLAEFEKILAINVLGSAAATKAVYPYMVKQRRGWIVNILSTAAIKTFTESSAYSATKAGLMALGNVLREEARRDNIRVTNVYPGPTETDMWSGADRRRYRARMMSPKSVAEAVLAVYQMPRDVVVEHIVLRPIQGDID